MIVSTPPTMSRRFAGPLLWLLLLLAALLRTIAAFQPGFHHPDAIYQYLEPAHRLLTGEGTMTWEWRVGMRSWLLPTLLALPMASGEAIDPAGPWAIALPRLAMGLASLSIVWSAWALGRRQSPTAGLLAAFVAATWFECIYFGVQTLAEPAATAAFLPAAVLATATQRSRRQAAGAGALLAFAVLMRPHYAPAAAALVVVAWWPLLRRREGLRLAGAMLAGAAAVAAVGACVDIAHGAVPFAWMVENVRQNIVAGAAAHYGLAPPLHYFTELLQMWTIGVVPIAIGVRFGCRACPALLAAAIVTLGVHSLIGHKEYRFVYLAVVALVVLSAIGWAELGRRAGQRWGAHKARWITLGIVASWGIGSLLLAQGPAAAAIREKGVPGSKIFAALRRDAATCGVALVYGVSMVDVPGTPGLRPGTPLALFWPNDRAAPGLSPWQAMTARQAGFNRIVGSLPKTGNPPPGYRTILCEDATHVIGLCLYARPGTCSDTRKSPFLLNRVLARRGF